MFPFYEDKNRDIRIMHVANLSFPPHLHLQLEFMLVTEGIIEVTVADKQKQLQQGDFAIVFPNSVHNYRTQPDLTSKIILVLCDLSWAGSWRNTIKSYEPDDPFLAADHVHNDISFAMTSLCKENEAAPALLKAYIQLALSRAIPGMSLHKNEKTLQSDSLHRIISYISENYHQPLTLDKLAAEMGISRYYLSRIFSTKLNTSFTDYLNSLRIDLAKNLLETGELDILQICFDCGFESQRTFNRVFKSECGITPREYRNQINVNKNPAFLWDRMSLL